MTYALKGCICFSIISVAMNLALGTHTVDKDYALRFAQLVNTDISSVKARQDAVSDSLLLSW